MGSTSFDRPTQVRYGVLALLCALAFVLYLDRICISQAAASIQKELHLTNTQMGYVFGAFTLAYGLFEVVTGRWGDRFGSRLVLIRIVLWWSVFTALTGCVWYFSGLFLFDSFALLLLVRFLFGVGEAGALPNIARVLARWFPPDRRGPAQGLINTAMLVGGTVAPVVTAYLIASIGWRLTFLAFGGLGVVWALVFGSWFRDRPADHPGVNEAERRLIEAGTIRVTRYVQHESPVVPDEGQVGVGVTEKPHADAQGPLGPGQALHPLPQAPEQDDEIVQDESHLMADPIPWQCVLGCLNIWLLGGVMSCLSSVTYFLYSWYPKYLQAGRGESPEAAGWLAGMVLACGAVGSTAGGFLCDGLIRRFGERRWTLRVLSVICLLIAAGAVGGSAACNSAFLSAGLTGLACCMIAIQVTAWWAVVTAISGKHLGALFGLMNSMGIVGAVSSQVLMGRYTDAQAKQGIFGRAQWDPAFSVFALVLLAAALAWLFIDAERSAVVTKQSEV